MRKVLLLTGPSSLQNTKFTDMKFKRKPLECHLFSKIRRQRLWSDFLDQIFSKEPIYIISELCYVKINLSLVACGAEVAVRNVYIWAYKKKNHERSLAYAQEAEKNYLEERKRTHPDEFEDEEEEEVQQTSEEETDE